MSAHDRAAANHARRFTLTAIRCSDGCMQTREWTRLTESEVEAQKADYRACWPSDDVSFDVEAA